MKKKKSLWGIGLTITYVSFAVGMLTLAVYASSSKFDFVSESYYEDSLTYQDVIDAQKRAEVLDQKPELIIEGKNLTVQLPKSLTIKKCAVEFYSPNNSQEDRVFQINEKPVSLKDMRNGIWRTTLTWFDEKNKMYMIKNIQEISE